MPIAQVTRASVKERACTVRGVKVPATFQYEDVSALSALFIMSINSRGSTTVTKKRLGKAES